MTQQRRSFTPEFKREDTVGGSITAIATLRQPVHRGGLSQLCVDGSNSSVKEPQGVTPKSKALAPEQQKIKELEARIDRLEREKTILIKATTVKYRRNEMTL